MLQCYNNWMLHNDMNRKAQWHDVWEFLVTSHGFIDLYSLSLSLSLIHSFFLSLNFLSLQLTSTHIWKNMPPHTRTLNRFQLTSFSTSNACTIFSHLPLLPHLYKIRSIPSVPLFLTLSHTHPHTPTHTCTPTPHITARTHTCTLAHLHTHPHTPTHTHTHSILLSWTWTSVCSRKPGEITSCEKISWRRLFFFEISLRAWWSSLQTWTTRGHRFNSYF